MTAHRHTPGDPLQRVNAQSFDATQGVDRAVIGPVAIAYKNAVPSPLRSGVRNFLYNLREPVVFVNYLLQLKPGKSAETLGRFTINSTLGAAGLIDIAKHRPFRLPRRPNGFADTLGYYGVKTGTFFYLPLLGPTTTRDLIGGLLDRLLLPVTVGAPFTSAAFTLPVGVLGTLDHRAEFDDTLHALHDDVPNAYAASRDFYLQRRQAELERLHGRYMPAVIPSTVTHLPSDLPPSAFPGTVPK